ncbi:MAG: GntR family transcriptional regulator [Clostridia bacterium]|nr:GntR family transcriptional regulator [Clostridia bacterium]
MQFDPMIPIWLQVATRIKQEIVTGTRPPGSKLPGGRDLAVAYGINPNTAARIYQELESEGVCYTQRGRGTFVTESSERIDLLRQEMARNAVRRFLSEIAPLALSREILVEMIEKEADSLAQK